MFFIIFESNKNNIVTPSKFDLDKKKRKGKGKKYSTYYDYEHNTRVSRHLVEKKRIKEFRITFFYYT